MIGDHRAVLADHRSVLADQQLMSLG